MDRSQSLESVLFGFYIFWRQMLIMVWMVSCSYCPESLTARRLGILQDLCAIYCVSRRAHLLKDDISNAHLR